MQARLEAKDIDAPDPSRLKHALDKAYERYCTEKDIKNDPIWFVTQYDDPLDKEVVGIIASSFAFGNVRQFMPVIAKLLAKLKSEPAKTLFVAKNGDFNELAKGTQYRFAKEKEITTFLRHIAGVLWRFGSLKEAFMLGYRKSHIFVHGLYSLATELRRNEKGEITDNVKVFVPDPKKNSAMKRLCMFCRWMVRRDFPDFGLWHEVDPRELVIPLDTHVFRVLRFLGLLQGFCAPSMKAASKATETLRRLAPNDPLRYDFALAHLGISRDCKGHFVQDVCSLCPLLGLCMMAKGVQV